MTVKEITNHLFTQLEPFGAIKWHTSTHGSQYIKFRDIRLGSIRIADHKGRERYSYTYELTPNNTMEHIEAVINSIKRKSKTIYDFNPEHYIVFDQTYRMYKQLDNFGQYKDHILKR